MRGDCTGEVPHSHMSKSYITKTGGGPCSGPETSRRDPAGTDLLVLDQIENDLLRQTHRFEEYLERMKNVCDRLQVWPPQPECCDKMIEQSTLPLEQIKRSISKYHSLNDVLLDMIIGLETL
jgi:hypothetical protein